MLLFTGENDDLAYEVLWLPGRYPFLVSYAILCGVLVLAAVWSVTRRPRNWYKCCRWDDCTTTHDIHIHDVIYDIWVSIIYSSTPAIYTWATVSHSVLECILFSEFWYWTIKHWIVQWQNIMVKAVYIIHKPLIGKTHIIVMWIAKQDIESWIAIIQACPLKGNLYKTHHKSMSQCISSPHFLLQNKINKPVARQTVNQNYHPNLWYSSVGRSTDIPLLEAGDYIQCPHFHALASQWQCSLHSWAVDRKTPWIKTLQMWRNKRTLSLRR